TGRAVLEAHLAALCVLDPRLAPILAGAGEVPLRLRAPGYAGLAQIVVSQLLLVASASAIHGRLERLAGEVSAQRLVSLADAELRAIGLSGGKIATLKGLAEAELSGGLDLDALASLDADAAQAALMAHRG